MTVFRHFQPDYRSDYRVTTGQTLPRARGSHFSEQKSTDPSFRPVAVVNPVVTKNGRFPRLSTLQTTDYSLEHKKEEEREKRPAKDTRARGVVVVTPSPVLSTNTQEDASWPRKRR